MAATLKTEPTLTCGVTGRPAHAELRLGLGAAWQGSRYDGRLFVVVDRSVPDGAYSDQEVTRLIRRGAIVEYGDVREGNLPAALLGVAAATELFLHGASEVERAVEAGGSDGGLARAVRQLSLALLGQPRAGQGADFAALGRLWALVERARGLRPFEDLDPKEIARQTYMDVLDFERGPAEAPPEPRRLH